MKNIILGISTLLMALVFTSCDKEEMIGVEGLPNEASTFRTYPFADIKGANVKKEIEGLSGTAYTVYLRNGVQVQFDKNGKCEHVEAPNGQARPTSFILTKIVEDVHASYPTA